MDITIRGFRFYVGPSLGIARSPEFFVTRGANFLFVGHRWGFLQLPWFWTRQSREAKGYERGWHAGYTAGREAGLRDARGDR